MAKKSKPRLRQAVVLIGEDIAARGWIIRGKRRGKQLNELLRLPPLDMTGWMHRHTTVLKSDTNSLAGLLQVKHKPCFLKLYRCQSRLRRALLVLGVGRPVRSYKVARTLAGQGVPVPCPFSCVLVPEGVLLLTEGFADGCNLSELWQQELPDEDAGRLMRGAGEAVAYLHNAGYTHGDCKWNNLLWSDGQCYLVDLDSARKSALGRVRRQARDLARFTVNAEEQAVDASLYEQFLDSYTQSVREPRDQVVGSMMRHLKKFRSRHLAQYAILGQHLL